MVLSLKYFLNIYALYERGLLKRKIYSRWIQQIYIDAKLTLKIHSYMSYNICDYIDVVPSHIYHSYYHWPHKCIHKNIRHRFNKKKFGNSYFLWILIKVYNDRLICINGNWSKIFVKLLRKGTSGGITILVILYIFLWICICK